MTADIRTAGERACEYCGKAYVPVAAEQRHCQNMCKRSAYMRRRYGAEYAARWRERKDRGHTSRGTVLAAPVREQVAEVLTTVIATHVGEVGTHWDGCWKYHAGCLAVLLQDLTEGERS